MSWHQILFDQILYRINSSETKINFIQSEPLYINESKHIHVDLPTHTKYYKKRTKYTHKFCWKVLSLYHFCGPNTNTYRKAENHLFRLLFCFSNKYQSPDTFWCIEFIFWVYFVWNKNKSLLTLYLSVRSYQFQHQNWIWKLQLVGSIEKDTKMHVSLPFPRTTTSKNVIFSSQIGSFCLKLKPNILWMCAFWNCTTG